MLNERLRSKQQLRRSTGCGVLILDGALKNVYCRQELAELQKFQAALQGELDSYREMNESVRELNKEAMPTLRRRWISFCHKLTHLVR